MNFVLRDISAKEIDSFWQNFKGEKTFLQGASYGAFREALGEKNFQKGIFWGDQMIGIAQWQKISARRGTHFHTPHGPLIEKKYNGPALEFFLNEYKKIGKKEGCVWVRVSPLLGKEERVHFRAQKFRPSPVHLVNPERTWVLNLQQSEEEILKSMRQSTRYEVRRIEKCGITVRMGNTKKDLDIFWELHEETVKRQGFVPFARHTTEKELKIFGEEVQIFSASFEQKACPGLRSGMCSSSIIIFDKNAAYYHQGASLHSKAPVSYATLWAAIREARKRGCKEFNFWGVSDEKERHHPWHGLSQFKRGFGGEERVFLHAQDAPLKIKYWLNWIIEKWRKWKRHY